MRTPDPLRLFGIIEISCCLQNEKENKSLFKIEKQYHLNFYPKKKKN